MKRVFVSVDFLLVGHLQTVLEQHRIGTLVKNAYLSGGAGELPPTECWPELWVREDEDLARAKEVIRGVLEADLDGAAWTCPGCGETIEPQFAACWRCGAVAPVAG